MKSEKCCIEKCAERAVHNVRTTVEDQNGRVIRRIRVPLCQQHFEAYRTNDDIIDAFVNREIAGERR